MKSLNKVTLIGNLGQDPEVKYMQSGDACLDYEMQLNTKICERCGNYFLRNEKISKTQWESRRFCSKSCSAKKHDIDLTAIASRYQNGESSCDIAKSIAISDVHVIRLLKKMGITLRTASDGKRLALSKPETRQKMREAATGRKLSESAKDKLRARVGPANHNWSAGLSMSGSGYLQFTQSPANGAHAGKTMHQVVAEWKYGRKTKKGEHIHHIDGNRLNNSPDNLVIMQAAEHSRLHQLGKKKNVK